MNGTEIPAARSPRTDEIRHGLALSLMGLGLFVALGAAGLLLHGLAGPETEHISTSQAAELEGWGVDGRQGVALAWTVPTPPSGQAAVSSEGPGRRAPVSPMGNPLVLVAEGLAELEADRGGESSLLLEHDGTLRTESGGTLVGFLHSGGSPERGDTLRGPGQIELCLLHQDSWLGDQVRVPVVEPSDVGGWVVRGHRMFGIEITREPKRTRLDGPGRVRLHPRTGLPQVELVSRRD